MELRAHVRFWCWVWLALPLCLGCGKSNRNPQAPKIKTADARSAPWIAGKHARVYHRRGCAYAADLESPVGYATVHDAARSGLIPCEFCKPRSLDRTRQE